MYRQSRSQGFGSEVKRRIMLGTYVLSAGYYDAYYRKASQVRTLIREDFLKAFAQCDALLAPVAPIPAFNIGEKTDDPCRRILVMFLLCRQVWQEFPAYRSHAVLASDKLPVGLQILGPHFRRELDLRIAYRFEQATPHLARQTGADGRVNIQGIYIKIVLGAG